MVSQAVSAQEMEIAHVLFMDIVSYSKLPMDEQSLVIGRLKTIVQNTIEFSKATAQKELVSLHTGDGMVLAFFGGPEAPVRCALEIAKALQAESAIHLRMGIHSGPVYRVKDIKGDENVAGGGINFAQRVMDCGDGGHILLSSAIAEVLTQHSVWAKHIVDIGIAEVKHGAKVHLYNYIQGDLGNPETPTKVKGQLPANLSAEQPIETPVSSAVAAKPLKLCLLYKRNIQPDEQLLKVLEESLSRDGHNVFIDRHLSIGVEWAKEIEQQIKSSDAVIALISQASVQSEMLAYELQIASEVANQNGGIPRIFPIRVDFEGPLPQALTAPLSSLQYALWKGESDSEKVLGQLKSTLVSPKPSGGPPIKPTKLEAVGGAVPLESKFYIVRPTDDDFKTAIERQDSIVLVKGARQMGKTSLLARGVQVARENGAKVVLTDFQKLNSTQLVSAEALFLALAEILVNQLDLEVVPQDLWNPKRGPSINFERILRREILENVPGSLVWVLDEVDRLFVCDFASEVFGLFRSWHNERSLDPSGPWRKLTMAIGYATEAHLFISDINQSPFNVGTRLSLQDFTLDQVAELNRRYGLPLKEGGELMRFYKLLGGQPYLVRRGLDELLRQNIGLDQFEKIADRDEGPFGDHLRRMLVLLARDEEMCEIVREILRGRPCRTSDAFYRLRSAGIMAGESAKEVHPRCQIYQTYLTNHLL